MEFKIFLFLVLSLFLKDSFSKRIGTKKKDDSTGNQRNFEDSVIVEDNVNGERQNKMESEHVQINHEIESMMLDQIDQRLSDLEDIKVDAVILVRHLEKHPNFTEFENYKSTINEIDNDIIESYKRELSLMKRKIIGSNHDIDKDYLKDINMMLDNAQTSVGKTRDMIDSFIDVHMESEEHKHEHDHDGHHDHHEDNWSDYADLITVDEEASQDEEKTLVETINKEVEELDDIEKYKKELVDHFDEHRRTDQMDTGLPESFLDEVNVDDIHEYKKNLLDLKKKIKESKGHLKIDLVDKVISTLDRANIFVEVSKERLEIVDLLDADADINAIANLMDDAKKVEYVQEIDKTSNIDISFEDVKDDFNLTKKKKNQQKVKHDEQEPLKKKDSMKKLPKEDNVRKENKHSNATKSSAVGSDVKRTMKKEGSEKDDTADLVFTFDVDDQDEDFVISLEAESDMKRPDREDAIETPEDADLFEIHFDDERKISEEEENVSDNDEAKNEIIEDVLEAFSKASDNVNDILHEKNINQDNDGIVYREDAEGVHNNYEVLTYRN